MLTCSETTQFEKKREEKKLRLHHRRDLNNSLELNISKTDDAIEEVLNTSIGDTTKSPITRLKELMDLKTITNLQYTEELALDWIFHVRVSLVRENKSFKADGQSRNKQEAKCKASQNMLDQLLERSIISKSPSTTPSHSSTSSVYSSTDFNSSIFSQEITNPVVKLQEYMQKRCADLPVYTEQGNQGPAHEPVFTVACTVNGRTEFATSSNKKDAKKMAAQSMVDLLMSPTSTNPPSPPISLSPQLPELIDNTNNTSNCKYSNPVSMLQEYMQKNNLDLPIYQLHGQQGPAHHLVFTIACTVNGRTAFAQSSKKTEAKKMAAHNMLDQLFASTTTSQPLSSPMGPKLAQSTVPEYTLDTRSFSGGVYDNPMALLHEYTQKRRLPLPVYVEKGKQGPAHNPVFTIACIVNGHEVLAESSNKKEAKKIAAQKMCHYLDI